MPYRSTRIEKAGQSTAVSAGEVLLNHEERHIRRKLLHMTNDDVIMLDLKEPVVLEDGDCLATEDGLLVKVIAAEEKLYQIRCKSPRHQMEIAWHLGNRHLAAEITDDHILIERDHVIRGMLIGLGAEVTDIVAPFSPIHGAYHGHGGHEHGSHDHHDHDHHHHDH
jgi:urease accessory protein